MLSWRDERTTRPIDLHKAGDSTASSSLDERTDERDSIASALETSEATSDQDTAEGYKPHLVSLADIVRLMVKYPTTIESTLDALINSAGNINNILNEVGKNLLDDLDFQSMIASIDDIISIINEFSTADFIDIPVLRTIKDCGDGLELNASNIISIFSGLLPSNVSSLISDVGGLIDTVQSISSLIENFSLSNLAGWALNATPIGGVLSNVLGLNISGLIGSVLGNGSVGGAGSLVASMIGGAGVMASGAAGFTQKSLSGGVEFPDGVRLSEKHVRDKEE